MMHTCWCANPDCQLNGCAQMRRGSPQPMWHNVLAAQIDATPRGCVCPPGSEKTCEGIGCPRQNPLKQK